MRVNTYRLLSDKIEEGIRGGLNKCFKRGYLMSAHPDGGYLDEASVEEIKNYIMNSICEYFDWEDEHETE